MEDVKIKGITSNNLLAGEKLYIITIDERYNSSIIEATIFKVVHHKNGEIGVIVATSNYEIEGYRRLCFIEKPMSNDVKLSYWRNGFVHKDIPNIYDIYSFFDGAFYVLREHLLEERDRLKQSLDDVEREINTFDM
jgi:hypothetical protein